MKIKKLLFLATYFPDPNNPSRGNWALEQAQAFQNAGIDVLVVVPTPWVPRILGKLHPKLAAYSGTPVTMKFGELQVEYPRWPCYPWHTFHGINRRYPDRIISIGWHFAQTRINRIVDRFKPDAIVAHHTLVAGQLALKLFKKHRTPYIVTDHEVGDLISCRDNAKVNRIFNDVGKHAKRMVVVSSAMQREGEAVLPNIPFSTIYNGSSFDIYKDRVPSPETGPVTVFCCSKFYGRKDIPLLLRAFDAVVEKGYDVRLRVAGDGPDRAKVVDCLSKLKHQDRVTLMGLLPSEVVVSEMQNADIFALVGWAEPFGVVFLEAMASGLPIIVSEDAGVAEILEDQKTAVLTRPHDQNSVESALVKLVENPELRDQIGSAGQKLFSQKFQWANVIMDYIHLFE
ncbi:glycosyltransferase family 4 protein [Puniceicoccales bacterium CK1056]|uniref:Glycosyltransferase family 4 protein n=1 Tax=Oceanipulchritudo coccoides TaxID=2706888 RepID=A0A6B2M086_9BACT|nr:glycosyltransferase family 4 protein [Oceanipulchritudo coccoides]NDV62328.1 glycosyltransferase family 4 protein [Oceanipulchritudo coccoides]